jgi:hypothetical protein
MDQLRIDMMMVRVRTVAMILVLMVVVYKQKDTNVTEQGELHGLLQETLLSLTVSNLYHDTSDISEIGYLTETFLFNFLDADFFLSHCFS